MPTPFYHHRVAAELLQHPSLPDNLRQVFATQLPAFFLGHVAPDVQVVSGQSRDETHFYTIPLPAQKTDPCTQFLTQYPSLAKSDRLSEAQRVFMAAYLCHLQADWIWLLEIFLPFFGHKAQWSTLPERLYLHNVLRSYLDFQALDSLNENVRTSLAAANPQGWLPFVLDGHLQTWRDILAKQLEPGAPIQTVEVFATRQGISTQEYYRLLASETEMEQRIFKVLSRERLAQYNTQLLKGGVQLLTNYLAYI